MTTRLMRVTGKCPRCATPLTADFDGHWVLPCSCGGKVIMVAIHGKPSAKPCDARCTGARGRDCECSCVGANHGRAYTLVEV